MNLNQIQSMLSSGNKQQIQAANMYLDQLKTKANKGAYNVAHTGSTAIGWLAFGVFAFVLISSLIHVANGGGDGIQQPYNAGEINTEAQMIEVQDVESPKDQAPQN